MFSGTARKKSSGKAAAELLVFGYACKLFRDDEKALYHEQGKQLIPWMGDSQILIDRYDGRGHLHDLSDYDTEHNSWNRNYNLSEEEARIEALCDEERYLALHTDLLEEEARQEEEYKRLSEALAEDGTYNTVSFQYKSDYYDPSQPTEEEEPQKDKDDKDLSDDEDNEEPFIAPEGLNVPCDVELPPTAKMHTIIERTALYVCKQGAQFEIMVKAKQARNSQFDFLRFDHYLNPYYKHIQKAMKEGRYTTDAEKQNKEEQKKAMANGDKNCEDDDNDDDDGEDSDYLHPSLFASKRCSRLEEITKPLKVVDPDHPLAALVRIIRKAKDEKMASQLPVNVEPAPTTETQSTADMEEAPAENRPQPSGSQANEKVTYRHLEQLRFLVPIVAQNETEGSYIDDEEESSAPPVESQATLPETQDSGAPEELPSASSAAAQEVAPPPAARRPSRAALAGRRRRERTTSARAKALAVDQGILDNLDPVTAEDEHDEFVRTLARPLRALRPQMLGAVRSALHTVVASFEDPADPYYFIREAAMWAVRNCPGPNPPPVAQPGSIPPPQQQPYRGYQPNLPFQGQDRAHEGAHPRDQFYGQGGERKHPPVQPLPNIGGPEENPPGSAPTTSAVLSPRP